MLTSHHVLHVKKNSGQSVEASWWRVCYQRGLPCSFLGLPLLELWQLCYKLETAHRTEYTVKFRYAGGPRLGPWAGSGHPSRLCSQSYRSRHLHPRPPHPPTLHPPFTRRGPHQGAVGPDCRGLPPEEAVRVLRLRLPGRHRTAIMTPHGPRLYCTFPTHYWTWLNMTEHDSAYQGFASGDLTADAWAVRYFVDQVENVLRRVWCLHTDGCWNLLICSLVWLELIGCL